MSLFGTEKKRPEAVESIKNMTERLNRFHPSIRLNMYGDDFDENDQRSREYRTRFKKPKKRKRAIIDNI